MILTRGRPTNKDIVNSATKLQRVAKPTVRKACAETQNMSIYTKTGSLLSVFSLTDSLLHLPEKVHQPKKSSPNFSGAGS